MKPSRIATATTLLLALMVRTARADEPAPEVSAPAPAERAPSEAEASEAPPASADAAPEARSAAEPEDAAEPAASTTEAPAEEAAPLEASKPRPVEPPPIAPVIPPVVAPVAAPAVAPPPFRIGRASPGTDHVATRDPEDGPLGAIRLGLLAGIGAPSAVSGQLLVTYKGWVGLSADYGALPTLTLPVGEGASFQRSQTTLSARVHPFRGAFFLGCGMGAARGHAATRSTDRGITGDVGMTANTVYVMPQIGFVHRFSFGLALGMDAGVELPVSSSTSVDATAQGVDLPVPGDLKDLVAMVGKQPIPVLNLLRLGYVL